MSKSVLLVVLALFFASGISSTYAEEKKQPQQKQASKAVSQRQAQKIAPQKQASRVATPNALKGSPHREVARHPGNRPEHNKMARQMERRDFRGGHGYQHFSVHEREIWHSGAWRHDTYQGRLGWWWVVGGMWYFFEQRPVELIPVIVPEIAFEAPGVVVPIPVEQPIMVAPPSSRPQALVIQPQAQQFWYWCSDPPGYAPYITKCLGEWQRRPAQVALPPPPQ